jgi:hypothetical protein
LQKLDPKDNDLIERYERPIPLVKFENEFMQVQFKKEDNRKQFERNAEEPMMLRLMKRSESPKGLMHNNQALMLDLFD